MHKEGVDLLKIVTTKLVLSGFAEGVHYEQSSFSLLSMRVVLGTGLASS